MKDMKHTQTIDLFIKLKNTPDENEKSSIRDNIISSNINLVIFAARKYSFFVRRKIPLTDLIQVGIIGLIKAVDRFNVDLGYKFSTYASYWIFNEITNTIDRQIGIVKIPDYVFERMDKMRKIMKENKKQDDIFLPETSYVSLNTYALGDDREMIELIYDKDLSPYDEVEYFETRDVINNELSRCLTYEEQLVVRKVFGLDEEKYTLAECGRELGCTKQNIMHILKRAMNKLRKSKKMRELYD